jgi:hypothetical protein
LTEPKSLADLAHREEMSALALTDSGARDTMLLQSFVHYASAAAFANQLHWPDTTWRTWRYRRANLARFLAREGMMRQVAAHYHSLCSSR